MALAILLALAAAAAHAIWNLLLKTGGDKLAFIWWSFLATSLLFAPLLVELPWPIPANAPWILLASGLAETGYCIFLTRAYERGPFSQVYPLARGSAPVFITLWAALLLAERPSPGGLLGMLLILTAIAAIATTSRPANPGPLELGSVGLSGATAGAARLNAALVPALGTGLCISIYSTIDKVGIQLIPPPAYLTLVYLAVTAILAPYVWTQRGPALMWNQLAVGWRSILAVGFLSGLTYLMVLVALQFGPVSYVGTARESSIIFGAILGRLLLGEAVRPVHVIAVVGLFLGIALLALAG